MKTKEVWNTRGISRSTEVKNLQDSLDSRTFYSIYYFTLDQLYMANVANNDNLKMVDNYTTFNSQDKVWLRLHRYKVIRYLLSRM